MYGVCCLKSKTNTVSYLKCLFVGSSVIIKHACFLDIMSALADYVRLRKRDSRLVAQSRLRKLESSSVMSAASASEMSGSDDRKDNAMSASVTSTATSNSAAGGWSDTIGSESVSKAQVINKEKSILLMLRWVCFLQPIVPNFRDVRNDSAHNWSTVCVC